MTSMIACICGSVSTSVQLHSGVDHSRLQLCHCNSCRAVTGQLSSSYYLLQHEPPSLDGLREYRQSNHVSRLFCQTCGAHVYVRQPDGQYLVASGLLVAKDVPSIQAIEHWKSSDTHDGGLGGFLTGLESTVTGCRLHSSIGLESYPKEPVKPTEIPPTTQRLRARCLCGGINFEITKPDESSSQAYSPWSDLLVPYHTGVRANPHDIKWWLRQKDTKYLAGICACNACRMSSGFPLQAWAFVPRSNIFNADGTPFTFRSSTMQRYNSSPGVYREFCSCCGASVFWRSEERPLLFDVSVGLLHANGARAEDWLDWATNRVSFAEMAVQPDLIQRLEDGMKAYSER